MGLITNKGFTLLEAVTGLAVMAVIAAIGIPNFISMRARAKINSAAFQVYGALIRARVESIATGRVHVAWFVSNGYKVFEDSNGSGNRDPGEAMICGMSFEDDYEGVTILNKKSVSFNSRGHPDGGKTVQLQKGKYTRNVTVSFLGRVRIL